MANARDGNQIVNRKGEKLVNMKFDLENKKHVNFVKLADDVLLKNCIFRAYSTRRTTFW